MGKVEHNLFITWKENAKYEKFNAMDKENASSSSQNVQSSPFDLAKKRQQLIDYSSVAACVVNDEMQKADAESQAQKIFKADVWHKMK